MYGQVRPGQFLRLERLAAEFGISVTPVREALQSLRSEGFVELEPRRGFVVAELSRQDINDLFWVQAVISQELASRACRQLTPSLLAELEEIHALMVGAVAAGDFDLVEDHNDRFHHVVHATSASRKLAWVLGAVTRYFPSGFYARIPGWAEASVRGHTEIIHAFREGDPQEAATATRTHVLQAGDLLLAHLERQGLWN
ncbi:GntR family transcriptional regulator [Actinocorallia longicatena]|uniref:GntR family transcriptional regulator n=2 Tax=Actinocorallia longicatena TaxID=111803 RepID=A0ABP6QH23_9ACTN